MLVYAVGNLGAFGLVTFLASKEYTGERVADFRDLAHRNLVAAFAMLPFLLFPGGIPPTAGFTAKLYLFAAVVHAGYPWLAVVGVVMSAVSLYCYFRIVREFYLAKAEAREGAALLSEAWGVRALVMCALATLFLGVYPTLPLAFLAPVASLSAW